MQSAANLFSPGGHIIFEKLGNLQKLIFVHIRYWSNHNHLRWSNIIENLFFPKSEIMSYYEKNIWWCTHQAHIFQIIKILHIFNFFILIEICPNYDKFCWCGTHKAHMCENYFSRILDKIQHFFNVFTELVRKINCLCRHERQSRASAKAILQHLTKVQTARWKVSVQNTVIRSTPY